MIVANKNKIVKLAENLAADEQTSGRSLWADARTRFMRNKAAITSLVILVLIVLFSFVGPYFAVWTYEQIDWNTMGSAATLGMPSLKLVTTLELTIWVVISIHVLFRVLRFLLWLVLWVQLLLLW